MTDRTPEQIAHAREQNRLHQETWRRLHPADERANQAMKRRKMRLQRQQQRDVA